MRKLVFAAAFGSIALAMATFTPAQPAQHDMTDGQVTKIDEPAEKITLRHGPIKSLDMDSMTMVFRVKEKAMLKSVKVGDKVKFRAERVNGQLTVTQMQKAR